MSAQRRLRPLVIGEVAVAWGVFVSAPSTLAQPSTPVGEWRAFGADPDNTKYSPLDQITAENFTDLEIAWRWTSTSTEVASRRPDIRPSTFKTTPLMVGGLVYASPTATRSPIPTRAGSTSRWRLAAAAEPRRRSCSR